MAIITLQKRKISIYARWRWLTDRYSLEIRVFQLMMMRQKAKFCIYPIRVYDEDWRATKTKSKHNVLGD